MEAILDWIKRILYFSVFITVFMQLLPGETYKKYVRFFAGILLIILAVTPVFKVVTENNFTEDILKQIAEQEEKTDMELDFSELGEAQQQYYRKQADAAVRSVVEEKAAQLEADVQQCMVEWSDDGENIKSLTVCIAFVETDDSDASEEGRAALDQTVIERIQIQVDTGKTEQNSGTPSDAANQLKEELKQTFELSGDQVQVVEG